MGLDMAALAFISFEEEQYPFSIMVSKSWNNSKTERQEVNLGLTSLAQVTCPSSSKMDLNVKRPR
jgi:hypothetical protein